MSKLNKKRDLSYLIPKGTKIYHNNCLNDIRICIYSGFDNKLLYNGELITLNKFCTGHMQETRPDRASNRNAWVTCYIEGPNLEKIKLGKIPVSKTPFNTQNDTNVKSKDTSKDTSNSKSKTYTKKNINVDINDDMDLKTTMDNVDILISAEICKKPMPKKKTKKIDKWDDLVEQFHKKMEKVWDGCIKEQITDPDDYSSVRFAIRPSKTNQDNYEMCTITMMRLGDIIPWKDHNNRIPDKFKDKNGYVRPNGEIAYEYIPYKNCPYHSLTKTIYRKYRYIPQLFQFVETGDIVTIDVPVRRKKKQIHRTHEEQKEDAKENEEEGEEDEEEGEGEDEEEGEDEGDTEGEDEGDTEGEDEGDTEGEDEEE